MTYGPSILSQGPIVGTLNLGTVGGTPSEGKSTLVFSRGIILSSNQYIGADRDDIGVLPKAP